MYTCTSVEESLTHNPLLASRWRYYFCRFASVCDCSALKHGFRVKLRGRRPSAEDSFLEFRRIDHRTSTRPTLHQNPISRKRPRRTNTVLLTFCFHSAGPRRGPVRTQHTPVTGASRVLCPTMMWTRDPPKEEFQHQHLYCRASTHRTPRSSAYDRSIFK